MPERFPSPNGPRYPSLSAWLDDVAADDPETPVIDFMFPSTELRDDYLRVLPSQSDADVKNLLRGFLVPSGTFGRDDDLREWVERCEKEDPNTYDELLSHEFIRRLLLYHDNLEGVVWEGVSWVLDLLPGHPRLALQTVSAYFAAHLRFMPDGRIWGMDDASAIITAKYIGAPHSRPELARFLQDLDSRSFECLVERLYFNMGYYTELTPPRRDGGRDIIATRQQAGQKERVLVECKRSPIVGAKVARELLGLVHDEKANKGTLVTPGRFTRGARDLADRNPGLELLGAAQTIPLINEHLGADWPLSTAYLVGQSERRAQEISAFKGMTVHH